MPILDQLATARAHALKQRETLFHLLPPRNLWKRRADILDYSIKKETPEGASLFRVVKRIGKLIHQLLRLL